MADKGTVHLEQVELNSEKSEKNVAGGNHHDKEKLKKNLKIFQILTVVGFLLALLFLIIMIVVAATEEEKEIIIDNTKSYNYWEEIVPESETIPDIRLAHGSTVYNGELLVFYGMNGNDADDNMLNDIWSYSTDKNTWTNWTTTGTAPAARYHFGSALIDNNLYIHGGYLNFAGVEESTNTFFKLNLETKVWEELTSDAEVQPSSRGAHEMIAYNGSLYIFGGSSTITDGELYDDLWIYNIDSKEWKEIEQVEDSDWPNERLGFNFYVNDNKFWLFAGSCDTDTEVNCSAGQSNDLWSFDPSTATWEQLFPTGNIPTARRATHSEVSISKHTFLIGGIYVDAPPTMMNDVHVYDSDTNRWIELHPEWPDEAETKIMSIRFGHIVEEIENKLYIFGGRCESTSSLGCNDLWVYTPPLFATVTE